MFLRHVYVTITLLLGPFLLWCIAL